MEPLGALIAHFAIIKLFVPQSYGMIKIFLAGLLVNTALNELIPGAEIKGDHKRSVKGIFFGMIFIAIIITITKIDFSNL